MYFCLRVDLDYVPWDTPDAKDFGHGEPAVFLRMLELAKANGLKFHFFSSNRNLQALPAIADTVLNEGHDLDWLCKHADQAETRFSKALLLMESLGTKPLGLAYKGAWPEHVSFTGVERLKFISTGPGFAPPGLKLFPVETKNTRDTIRSGSTIKSWSDSAKIQIREAASRRRGITLVVRPQVMGRYDPKLGYLREIVSLSEAVGMEVKTLRDVLTSEQ